jgi:hypothetical protein
MRSLPALAGGALRSPLGQAGEFAPLLQEQDAQEPLAGAVLGSGWLPVRAEAIVPVGLGQMGKLEPQGEEEPSGTFAALRAVVQLGETGAVMVAPGLGEGMGKVRR